MMHHRIEGRARTARARNLGSSIAQSLLLPIALLISATDGAAAQTDPAPPSTRTAPAPVPPSPPPPPPPPGGSLMLDIQPKVGWREGRAIQIVVATKLAPAKNLSLAAGPFVEAETQAPLQLSFCLADAPKGRCGPQEVAANSDKPLWLIPTGSAEAGSYAGTVRLRGDAGLEVSKPVTIAITDDEWRAWGFAALLAGVLLSFLLAVWMPHQRRRDLALRPFALLAERLRKTQADLGSGQAGTIERRIETLLAEFTQAKLQAAGLVPSRWPSASATADPGDELKKRYDAYQLQVAALEMLAAAILRAPDLAKRKSLDDLAAAASFPQSDLAAQIDKILLGPPPVNARRAGAAIPTPAELVAREESRNLLFWVASSLITVAAGYALLIDANAAFGGWTDVVAVFLWGVGLSTSGTKLSDMSQSQIRTALRPA